MSAPDLAALAQAVTHAATNLASAREDEKEAREELRRAEGRRNRLDVELKNARAALDKALDS